MVDWLTTGPEDESLLDAAVMAGKCYTSVLNALELLSACSSPEEEQVVQHLFRLVRVLGFPSRSVLTYAQTARLAEKESQLRLSSREAMVLGLAKESKLTILTQARYDRYRALNGVQVARAVESATAIEV